MVKADAYGHGSVPVARAVTEAGATWLGVATAEEAEELRAAGLENRLLVVGPLTGRELNQCATVDADVIVWSRTFLKEAIRSGCRVHLKLDTGMGRLGARQQHLEELVGIAAGARADLVGLMTHFATADEYESDFFETQLHIFTKAVLRMRQARPWVLAHAANSAAILRERRSCFDMVRPGIAMYGLSPFNDSPDKYHLAPALQLLSYLAAIREFSAEESVGYGRAFMVERPVRVGVVPIGYADGVPRSLSNSGHVLIRGFDCPIVGRVSMDQLTVLLPQDVKNPGETVVLIGPSGTARIGCEDVALRAGTIVNEIVSRIGPRVRRDYIG